MDTLLYLIGPLGCAAVMGVCMAMMGKGMRRRGDSTDSTVKDAQPREVAELRAEIARLRETQREPADD